MSNIVFVLILAAAPALAHRGCRAPLAPRNQSIRSAKRIGNAIEALTRAEGDPRQALEELLEAYREVGGGRATLDRGVRVRLRPAVPLLYAMLAEAEPSRRWPIAYVAAALRAPEVPAGSIRAADEISETAREAVRREFELYLAQNSPVLFTRIEVERKQTITFVNVAVDNEFSLGSEGIFARTAFPVDQAKAMRVRVSDLHGANAVVTPGPVHVADGRLRGEVRMRVSRTTTLFIEISVDGIEIERKVLSGTALSAP